MGHQSNMTNGGSIRAGGGDERVRLGSLRNQIRRLLTSLEPHIPFIDRSS